MLRMAVNLANDGDPDVPVYLPNLGETLDLRFEHSGKLEDLVDAISNMTTAVDHMEGHPAKPHCLSKLGLMQRTRFQFLGDLSDLENAILCMDEAVVLEDDNHQDKLTYLCHLGNVPDLETAISNISKAVDQTGDAHPDRPMYLASLGTHQSKRFEMLRRIIGSRKCHLKSRKSRRTHS